MIRKIFVFISLSISVFALSFDYETFEANFVQSIKNKSGKKIVYSGKVIAKKPNYAVWEYTKPVKKIVYVNNDTVIIYEPLLSQAKYLKKKNSVSLDAILKKAKPEGNDEYSAKDGDITYKFKVKDNMIERLTYKDSLENDTEIVFSERKKNSAVSQKTFEFTPSADIDIIK